MIKHVPIPLEGTQLEKALLKELYLVLCTQVSPLEFKWGKPKVNLYRHSISFECKKKKKKAKGMTIVIVVLHSYARQMEKVGDALMAGLQLGGILLAPIP